MKYARGLLNDVKLGRGPHMKALRDELDTRPEIKKQFLKDRATEISNGKQREKMMWVMDANSRVHRVQTEFRDKCTFTNPMHTHEVPQRRVVESAARAPAQHSPRRNPNGAEAQLDMTHGQ